MRLTARPIIKDRLVRDLRPGNTMRNVAIAKMIVEPVVILDTLV